MKTSEKRARLTEKLEKPNPLRLRYKKEAAEEELNHIHIYFNGAVCETDTIGKATPEGRSPLEIVVDASEGFIPLWEEDVTLRWRFQERSMTVFRDPEAAKGYIRELFAQALDMWDFARPVKFAERHDAWDFEIAVKPSDNCTTNGCTLARAFFPDAGRHELVLFPILFEQSVEEQVETLAHEVGHIFGLRHFFANVSETSWPSEIFGEHKKFSIMNYGAESEMTDADKEDLAALYSAVWSGSIEEINGTPIRLFRPYSEHRATPDLEAIAALRMK